MLQCTWASSGECVKACTGGEKSIESIGALRAVIRADPAEGQSAASTCLRAIKKEKSARVWLFHISRVRSSKSAGDQGADLDLPGDQANGHEELSRGGSNWHPPRGGVHNTCASPAARQPATLNKATRKSNEPHADSLDWHRNGGDGFQRPTHQPRTERASGRRRAWASSVDESGSRGSGSEDSVCNECVQCVKCVQCVQCRD